MSKNTEPTVVKWQDPPAPRGGRNATSAYAAAAAVLRANPGRWALIAERKNSGFAGNISSGRTLAFASAGAFEAASRKRADGDRYDIYARYVGEAVAS